MSKPTPILFLTDSPDLSSGLARIGRDLATRLAKLPEFRVGFLGRGGIGGDFPFPVWTIPTATIGQLGSGEWGSGVLRQVWQKFAGGEGDPRGVIFTIGDAGRYLWLSRPEFLLDGELAAWLKTRPAALWGYFPVDGETAGGTLGIVGNAAVAGYDRVLGYGEYGAGVLGKALGRTAGDCVAHLPHGIDEVWSPQDKVAAKRDALGVAADCFVVGVVATNQPRKNWALAGEIGARLLARHGERLRLWWHVDHVESARGWDLNAIIEENGIERAIVMSQPPQPDEWLAKAYAACDVTLGIGDGEGFGYPIAESEACGTPCVTWEYAGGAELASFVVPPVAWRVEGPTNVRRPVGAPDGWIRVMDWKRKEVDVASLRWGSLWPRWEQWFREGKGG